MSYTRLDAINSCLRGVGIAPVATEDDPDLDAALAAATVDTISSNIQSRGWWFNKERNWKITPDETTGYVAVPGSAMSIVSSGDTRWAGLTIRGTKVYDLWNHTFDLRPLAVSEPGVETTYIEFTFITELAFEDMPPLARQAVTYAARRLFAQDLEVDEKRLTFQDSDEKEAMIMLMREDARNNKRNYLRDNNAVSTFISLAGGVNSLSQNLGTFPKREE